MRTKKLPARLVAHIELSAMTRGSGASRADAKGREVVRSKGGGEMDDLYQRFVWDMEAMQMLADHGPTGNEFLFD